MVEELSCCSDIGCKFLLAGKVTIGARSGSLVVESRAKIYHRYW